MTVVFLCACTVRPGAPQCLVARYSSYTRSYYFESSPIEGLGAADGAVSSIDDAARIHLAKSEIEAYVLSQIKWPMGNLPAKIEVGVEGFASLNGSLVFAIYADYVQPQDQWHGRCDQSLTVLVSLDGKPLGVTANKLATCLA